MKYTTLLHFLHTLILRFFDTNHCTCGNTGYILCPLCIKETALAHETPNAHIYCLYSYKNKKIAEVIHALKFKGAWWYSSIFGTPLYEKIHELAHTYTARHVYILPIPISKKREQERGYNQCEKLLSFIEYTHKGHVATIKDKVSIMPALFFIKDKVGRQESGSDEHLSRLSKPARAEKIKGQFFIRDMSFIKSLSEKDLIILLDDVTTTGSTLDELRDVLKPHTNSFIIGLAVAH